MDAQINVTQKGNYFSKINNAIAANKKKTVILIFVLFAVFVAVQTLVSELNKDKPKDQEKNIIAIPTIPQQGSDLPGVNSEISVVNTQTSKYNNTLIGFSFEYPSEVGIVQENGMGDASALTIKVTIDELNNPYTPGVEQLRSDRPMLERGDFGLELVPGKYFLKGVAKSGSTNIKIFTNLEDSQCDGVNLDKVAQFYRFDRRITLTLTGPKQRLINENPNYFVTGTDKCEDEYGWSQIGQESFLSAITKKTAPDYILNWDKYFSNIISTLKLDVPSDPQLFDRSLVKGRWEGEFMVITFVANNKLGKVVEMKVWYGDNENGNWEPFTSFKRVPSMKDIHVRYKDEYGNVSRVLSTNVEFK